jgi:hypothetical protein
VPLDDLDPARMAVGSHSLIFISIKLSPLLLKCRDHGCRLPLYLLFDGLEKLDRMRPFYRRPYAVAAFQPKLATFVLGLTDGLTKVKHMAWQIPRIQCLLIGQS